MEIVTLQRRLVEVGRIRLGAKKTSQNGKQYPAKLEKFRLTSRDKQRLDAAAALYGGEVVRWENGWELFTESDVLPVAVVPGQALNQSFELWGQKSLPGGKKSGVICLRRCDGETESLTGEACLCAAADEPVCKPTTRLSVVLTDVPGIGVWRVEAHGWNAASELAGCVRLLEALVAGGHPVRARLRLDSREQTTESETRHFVVPVLDIDHTLGQVLDSIGAGPVPRGAVGDGAVNGVAGVPAASFTPVPVAELAPGPQPSIREQVASVAEAVQRPTRSNGAQAIPATGLKPRTAADANAGAAAAAAVDAPPAAAQFDRAPMIARAKRLPGEWQNELNRSRRAEDLPALANGTFTAEQVEAYERLLTTQEENWARKLRGDLGRRIREIGLTDDERHVFVSWVTEGAADGLTGCTLDQLAAVDAMVARFQSDEITVSYSPEGTISFTVKGAE